MNKLGRGKECDCGASGLLGAACCREQLSINANKYCTRGTISLRTAASLENKTGLHQGTHISCTRSNRDNKRLPQVHTQTWCPTAFHLATQYPWQTIKFYTSSFRISNIEQPCDGAQSWPLGQAQVKCSQVRQMIRPGTKHLEGLLYQGLAPTAEPWE